MDALSRKQQNEKQKKQLVPKTAPKGEPRMWLWDPRMNASGWTFGSAGLQDLPPHTIPRRLRTIMFCSFVCHLVWFAIGCAASFHKYIMALVVIGVCSGMIFSTEHWNLLLRVRAKQSTFLPRRPGCRRQLDIRWSLNLQEHFVSFVTFCWKLLSTCMNQIVMNTWMNWIALDICMNEIMLLCVIRDSGFSNCGFWGFGISRDFDFWILRYPPIKLFVDGSGECSSNKPKTIRL